MQTSADSWLGEGGKLLYLNEKKISSMISVQRKMKRSLYGPVKKKITSWGLISKPFCFVFTIWYEQIVKFNNDS